MGYTEHREPDGTDVSADVPAGALNEFRDSFGMMSGASGGQSGGTGCVFISAASRTNVQEQDTKDYLTRCFIKTESIVSRKIGEEFILVPMRKRPGEVESVYTLNEVAARIWELTDGSRSVAQVRDAIVAEFEVRPEEAEKDVIELLLHLAGIGALREIEP